MYTPSGSPVGACFSREFWPCSYHPSRLKPVLHQSRSYTIKQFTTFVVGACFSREAFYRRIESAMKFSLTHSRLKPVLHQSQSYNNQTIHNLRCRSVLQPRILAVFVSLFPAKAGLTLKPDRHLNRSYTTKIGAWRKPVLLLKSLINFRSTLPSFSFPSSRLNRYR